MRHKSTTLYLWTAHHSIGDTPSRTGERATKSVTHPISSLYHNRRHYGFRTKQVFFFFLPRERFSSRHVTRGSSKRSMDPLHFPNEAIGAPYRSLILRRLHPWETISISNKTLLTEMTVFSIWNLSPISGRRPRSRRLRRRKRALRSLLRSAAPAARRLARV